MHQSQDPLRPLIEPHLLWPHLPEAVQQTLRRHLLQVCQSLLKLTRNPQEKTHESNTPA